MYACVDTLTHLSLSQYIVVPSEQRERVLMELHSQQQQLNGKCYFLIKECLMLLPLMPAALKICQEPMKKKINKARERESEPNMDDDGECFFRLELKLTLVGSLFTHCSS
jgi:hypothetical protein